MIAASTLDEWFRHHAPTPDTQPRYEAIRLAQAAATTALVGVRVNGFDDVNRATRAFADVINELAPDCADKTAALRCIRLARNAANELIQLLIVADGRTVLRDSLVAIIETELMKARWQACAAVALNGL